MSHKIRLGPIAVFLAVVAVVLTTLATLTTATSNADTVLAKRFADVTRTRYALEAEGQKMLSDFDESAAKGGADGGGFELKDGVYTASIEKDGYVLNIELTQPDDDGAYDIKKWKITKIWDADSPVDDIWTGGL